MSNSKGMAESKGNFQDWVMEQEVDEIPSYCWECGKVHGPEACQYDEADLEIGNG